MSYMESYSAKEHEAYWGTDEMMVCEVDPDDAREMEIE